MENTDKENKESENFFKTIYYNDLVLSKILNNQLYFPFENLFREFSLLNYGKRKISEKEKIVNLQNPELKEYRKIAFRCITFKNLWFFKKTLEYLGFYKNDSNMYSSIARLKQLPIFPFPSKDRVEKTKPFFEKDYIKYISHYDIYLDFDIKDFKEIPDLLSDLTKIILIIKQYNLKAEVVFSGSRGFKVLIYNNVIRSIKKISEITSNIKNSLGLDISPDLAGIGIPSKLMKCNFSLVFKEKSIKVCFPLKENNYLDIFSVLSITGNFEYFNFSGFDKLLDIYSPYYDSDFLINTHYQKNNLLKFIKDYNLCSGI